MASLMAIGLSNALVATLLALAAFAAARWTRNPPLAHFLWLLVLAKLLTPPLMEFRLPLASGLLGRREGHDAAPAAVSGPHAAGPRRWRAATAPGIVPVRADPRVLQRDGRDDSGGRADGAAAEAKAAGALGGRLPPVPTGPLAASREGAGMEPLDPAGALATAWLSGSLLWYALAASRLLRFRRLLRRARPAPAELVEETRRVATRLGVKRVPDAIVLGARVPPLLWAMGGRARVVLPEELVASLTAGQRQTLIAHELAHLRRRDHWLRWLEMLALGLYWWFPIAWWARRELRQAEEECCDAWVRWAFPGGSREYAMTLVRTVDFLSPGPSAALDGASGMGQINLLERRFRMILHGRSSRRLSGLSRAALATFAALVLPWTAALTAEEAGGEKEGGEAGSEGEELPPAGSGAADAEERIRSLQRQIDRLQKDLEALEAGKQGPALHLEGKSVTLKDPVTRATVWTTTLDADVNRAWIEEDAKSKRLLVRTPEKTVVLDLATGRVLEEKKSTDLGRQPGKARKQATEVRRRAEPGAGLHAPAAPASLPVDVVRLGEALVEARGAMLLARNTLEAQAGADAAGVIPKSEVNATRIQIETAERKIELLRRMAQSALKGTKQEMAQLREMKTMAKLRSPGGEANENALMVSMRLATVEMLASLIEDILAE